MAAAQLNCGFFAPAGDVAKCLADIVASAEDLEADASSRRMPGTTDAPRSLSNQCKVLADLAEPVDMESVSNQLHICHQAQDSRNIRHWIDGSFRSWFLSFKPLDTMTIATSDE